MTGRTHDLAAFTALTYVFTTTPLQDISLATALVAFSANMIGGLAPDIDQPTAALWRRMRGGNILGKLIQPLLGGHRYISHSIIGIFLFGIVLNYLLQLASNVVLIDMEIVWWAFMIGMISHLIMDSFTEEGVPWFFPIPIKLGFPPFRFLRIKTNGIVEKSFVFPVLLMANVYMFWTNYQKVLEFLKYYLK